VVHPASLSPFSAALAAGMYASLPHELAGVRDHDGAEEAGWIYRMHH